jgi:hypothetical protein
MMEAPIVTNHPKISTASTNISERDSTSIDQDYRISN